MKIKTVKSKPRKTAPKAPPKRRKGKEAAPVALVPSEDPLGWLEPETTIKLPEREEFRAQVMKRAEEAASALALVKSAELTAAEHFKWAAHNLEIVASLSKTLTAERQDLGAEARAIVDGINAAFRTYTKAYDEAEALLKAKLGDYAVACALAGREVPQVDRLSITLGWSGEVTDPAALPKEYTISVPDVPRLIAATAANAGKVSIPGWAPKMVASTKRTA